MALSDSPYEVAMDAAAKMGIDIKVACTRAGLTSFLLPDGTGAWSPAMPRELAEKFIEGFVIGAAHGSILAVKEMTVQKKKRMEAQGGS